MNEDYSITYQNSNGEEKEVNFTLDPNVIKLFNGLKNPLGILKNSAEFGIKGAGKSFGVIAVAVVINVLFFIIALIVTAFNFFDKGLISLGLVAVLGFVFSFIMIRKAYSFALTKIIEAIYRQITPLFKRLCTAIVDKTAAELAKHKTPDTFMTNSVSLYGIYNDKLDALPAFVRKVLWFVVKRIPFVTFFDKEITDTIVSGDKQKAAEVLFTRTDGYINENVFEANNLKWLWWMLPLNIAVHIALIVIKL
jgi:hypothetical protein